MLLCVDGSESVLLFVGGSGQCYCVWTIVGQSFSEWMVVS